MPSLEVISTLTFFLFVAVLIFIDRKNIEFHKGVIIRRTKKGKEIIDNFVKGHKKSVRLIGTFAVVLGLIASIGGFLLLAKYTLSLEQMFGLVLPTAGGYQYPGPIIGIPFWYWLVGIFVIIASHETMHAVFARLEKIRIKNYGVMLLFVLPIGAFVDPDMKQVKKLKLMKKLRIFAGGSFGNFVVGILVLLIALASTYVSSFVIEDVGIKFDSTINGTPADSVGLKGVITQINNETIKNRVDFLRVLNETKPNDNITIATTSGIFYLQTMEHPEQPGKTYIGISNPRELYKYKMFSTGVVPEYITNTMLVWFRLLFWLFLLSIGVGVANLLPMKPLDGGYMFEEIFKKIFKKKGGTAIYITSIITLSLLLFNLFGIKLIKSLI